MVDLPWELEEASRSGTQLEMIEVADFLRKQLFFSFGTFMKKKAFTFNGHFVLFEKRRKEYLYELLTL